MAFTVTKTPSVFGNKRAVALKIIADAATQTVETGLSVIEWHAVSPVSCTTASIKVYYNSNASGVQSMGVLGISGAASGDIFFVTVFGQ